MIYLIKTIDDSITRVKIGFTTNSKVDIRRIQLQTGSPYELKVLWSIPGIWEAEQWLHNHFMPYCVHGEWYEFHERDPIAMVEKALLECPYADPTEYRLHNTLSKALGLLPHEPPKKVRALSVFRMRWMEAEDKYGLDDLGD